MHARWSSSVLFLSLLGVAAGPAPPERADLVIVNAHVWTVDDSRPEAGAVAVRGERIVFVGTSDEVRRLTGSGTRVIDAGGRLLLPGFQDGHTHFVSSGSSAGSSPSSPDASRPARGSPGGIGTTTSGRAAGSPRRS